MGFGISPVANYNFYTAGNTSGKAAASAQKVAGDSSGTDATQKAPVAGLPTGSSQPVSLRSPSVSDEEKDRECQTCKNRKYQDGSDEMVSFKSASHISPDAAASAVRGHEQEHVSNAYKKASQGNGKVISAAVSIHMSVCPECGRSYVSGGTTNTTILYKNEENPYQKDLKAADYIKYSGMNLNKAV
jgi:hypothetical protein